MRPLPPRTAPQSPREDDQSRALVGFLLFFLLFSVYVFTMTGTLRFGDEGERYLTAQSLVERHDLAIRVQPDLHRKPGVDGRNYSSYELGSIVPLVPFYAAGSWLARIFPFDDPSRVQMLVTGLFNPFVTALTAVVLFEFCLALGATRRDALAVAAIFGLATIAWPYSRAFEREPLLGLLLLLSAYGTFRFGQDRRMRWLALGGTGTGLLVFAKLANVIVLPILFLYLAFGAIRNHLPIRQTVWLLFLFFLPTALFTGIQGASNYVRFGHPLDIGLAGTWGNPLSYFGLAYLPAGLAGLLFSGEKSIFLYSLPTLFFIPGWIVMLKRQGAEALLIGLLIAANLVFNAMNSNWAQTSWWGPKYLVPLTPLLLLPVGALLSRTQEAARRVWSLGIGVFALEGLGIQLAAVSVDDREYLDVVGRGIDLGGALNWLRHGAINALLISSSAGSVHVNPYGFVLGAIVLLLGVLLVLLARGRATFVPGHIVRVLLLLCVLVEGAGFILWVVTPYPQVLSAKADTKVSAGEAFLADGRSCEAAGMYLMALDGGTMLRALARDRLERLLPHAAGDAFTVDELRHEVELAGQGTIRSEERVALVNGASLDIAIPAGQDGTVTAISKAIEVLPDTRYQLFGWMQTQNVYGSGYAAITLYEDDGAWKQGRDTPVVNMDATRGWQPFWKEWTTLPTTRRLYIKTGLWKTYGTVWVDGVELGPIPGSEPAGPHAVCPQMN